MTHKDIILKTLNDRRWHSVFELMEAVVHGGRNIAVRSRLSDLRKLGYVIDTRLIGKCAEYRLVSTPEEQKGIVYKEEINGQTTFA